MKADCHIHMVLDGMDWKASIARGIQDPYIHSILKAYADGGYTYLRDGGDRWGVGKRARELAAGYGITYKTPLAPLCLKGHYGGFIGLCYESTREFADLVVQQRSQGADFVKIMISGLMDFDRFGILTEPGLEPTLIRELIHIAHEEGFAVMAHANGARTVEAAAMYGVDSVEHGAYQDAESLQAMAENGTVWVPTLSTIGNLRGKGRFSEPDVKRILDSAMENVAKFAAMGGLVAVGTDAGAWAVPHGCATEEEHLRFAGVTVEEGAVVENSIIMQKGTVCQILVNSSLVIRLDIAGNVAFCILENIQDGGGIAQGCTAGSYVLTCVTNPLPVVDQNTGRVGAVVQVGVHTADDVVAAVEAMFE